MIKTLIAERISEILIFDFLVYQKPAENPFSSSKPNLIYRVQYNRKYERHAAIETSLHQAQKSRMRFTVHMWLKTGLLNGLTVLSAEWRPITIKKFRVI